MLAAFLEWFLWLAAFLYCLVKVFQKAEHWTIRLLAVIVMIIFTVLRYVNTLCNLDMLLMANLQSNILAYHDRNPSITGAGHAIFSCIHGIIPSVVCILVLCWATNDPVAILRLPTCHQQHWSHQKDQGSA